MPELNLKTASIPELKTFADANRGEIRGRTNTDGSVTIYAKSKISRPEFSMGTKSKQKRAAKQQLADTAVMSMIAKRVGADGAAKAIPNGTLTNAQGMVTGNAIYNAAANARYDGMI